jgi:hypothetical protein
MALIATGAPFSASAQEVSYDPSPDSVVVRLTESYGELAGESSYTLYGDGRIETRHPPGRIAPQGPRAPLSAVEVRSLLQRIASRGVADFDAERVRARMRDADAAPGRRRRLFYASDASNIEIRFSYAVVESDGDVRSVERNLQWRGLRHDARRYPGIAELQQLETLRRELAGLAGSAPTGAP